MLRAIDRLCAAAAGLAAGLLGLLFALGLAELIARNVVGIGLAFATEYAGYLLAAILTLPLGHVMTRGRHIRVGLLRDALPAPQQRTLDLAATLIGLVIAAAMSAALVDYAARTFAEGARSYFTSQTPLWLPQALVAAGPCLLTLALVARLVRLLRGDPVAG